MAALKITTAVAKVLQALRAGPMDGSQLYERFGSYHAGYLIEAGLVELVSGYYKITAEGRKACPNRRGNMQSAIVVPVVHRKHIDTPITVVAGGAHASATKPPRRSERPIPPPVVIEKKEVTEMPEKSKIQQILEYIEQNPNCSTPAKILGISGVDGFVGPYIHKREVIKTGRGRGATYRLKEGLTTVDILNNRQGGTKPPIVTEHVPKFGEADKAPVSDSEQTESDVTINLKGEAAADFKDALLEKLQPSHEPLKPKVRFALTSDRTLIIQGTGYQDIELNQSETEALVDFVDSISMTIDFHDLAFGEASL